MKNILFFVIVTMMTITTATAQEDDYKKDSLLQQQQQQNYFYYLSSTEDTLVSVMIHIIDTIDRPEKGWYLVREPDGSYDTINPKYSCQYTYSFGGYIRYNKDIEGEIEYLDVWKQPIRLLEGQTITYEMYKKPIPQEEYLEKYK